MTEISPAAQAVLNAFDAKDSEMSEVSWLTRDPNRDCLAAALRAVVDQLTFKDSLAGDVINPRELLALADELEGKQ